MEFIDLKAHYRHYQQKIDARIRKVLDHGHYIMGPEIEELESVLAEYVGSKHSITVASGTDSLEIALRALGIGAGDEVITTPFSWISSVEVIAQVGATPVFVDIDPLYYTIDEMKIEAAITKRTKAIIAVSLFGQMPNLEYINKIADRYRLTIVEDAAQSFGASRNGKKSCGAGVIGSTSFFPAKPLGCFGDGGALFTNDDELADKMRAIRTHGGVRRHHHNYLGMNGRFDTLQAAIILGKWDGFPEEVTLRQRIGARYSDLLSGIVSTPEIAPGNTHVYAQYTIRVDACVREQVVNALETYGIPTGIYYPKCIHEQPIFSSLGYKPDDFPNSLKASREVLSLPMHPFLSTENQDMVVRVLTDVLAVSKKSLSFSEQSSIQN